MTPAPGPASASFPGWDEGFALALTRLRFALRQPAAGRWAGPDRSRQKGRGLEFLDHRPYAPGDDPRLVDWRAYARHRRLLTRQFAEDREQAVVLILDRSGSMDLGEGPGHKGRWSLAVAAALAQIGVLQHQATAVVVLLEPGGPRLLPPAAGREGLGALFARLGAVPPPAGEVRLGEALARLRGLPLPSGPAVLLSDLLTPDWPQAVAALGALGARGFDPAVIQPLAPEEWEPPLAGDLELEDAETGLCREAVWSPRGLEAYRERLAAFLEAVRGECHRRGVRHVALSTGVPVPGAVLRDLPRAGLLTVHG